MKGKGQTTFIKVLMVFVTVLLIIGFLIAFFEKPISYTLPAGFKNIRITGIASTLLQVIGIPTDWLWIPAVIYLFFVPFLGIITIVYGFLDTMRIFRNANTNLILGILFAFATIPFGIFTRFVMLLFTFMGAYSTGAFAFLFFFGVIYVVMDRMGAWGFRRGREVDVQYMARYIDTTEGWFREIINANKGNPNDNVQKGIAMLSKALDDAEREKVKGNPRNALKTLEDASRREIERIANNGGTIPPRTAVPK